MFEYGKVKGASMYCVQVKELNEDTSSEYCFTEQTDSSTATMVNGLEFGKNTSGSMPV
jgi:hypothetical protein